MIFRREGRSDKAERQYRRARQLAAQRSQLHRSLVNMRRAKGLTQQDVADELGLSQATIAAFERYDNDPRISTIHRYALAIGANLSHIVIDDDAPVEEVVEIPEFTGLYIVRPETHQPADRSWFRLEAENRGISVSPATHGSEARAYVVFHRLGSVGHA